MNYSTSKYIIKNTVVNKVIILDECWFVVYNDSEKKIITKPTKISNSTFKTINVFCIRETEEELIQIINELGLSGINSDYQTIIDKAIKDVSEYTSS